MRMPPLRQVPGLSRAAYLDAQRAVFDASAGRNVPLVYHADLTLHGGFVEEYLQAHPQLRVNIPHFGFSRKRMAALLDRYPALMTDISSLGPYMDTNPGSYRNFILDYPDRVMLGSDTIASHDMRIAMEYVHRVRALELAPQVEAGVLAGNARRFLYG
jgi:predicted TIM-barrel fold metal-dependent hydrolase